MIEVVNPEGSAFPGLSQAAIARDGDLMFLTGQVGTDASGEIGEDDFEAQVRAAFANIERTLAAAGVGFDALLRLTYYLTDYSPEMITIIKKVRQPFLSAERPPASVLISVAALYDPRLRIEVEAVAIVPRKG